MTSDDQVNAALEREAEFDRLELEVGASTAPYLRATTAERDRRVLAAEVRRLREENAVYEPAAKNWPAMIARCEAAEDENAELREGRIPAGWLAMHANDKRLYDAARAEVARLREANMELRVQLRGEADARVGDLQQLSAEQASLEHDLTALRARHAEAVEKAFREGWTWLEPYCESADGAWLASEARRKVGI